MKTLAPLEHPHTRLGAILTESPVTILAGPGKIAYYVHRKVLTAFKGSEAATHLSGNAKDSYNVVLDWTDTEVSTVELALQYFYTGDYYVPAEQPEKLDSKSIRIDPRFFETTRVKTAFDTVPWNIEADDLSDSGDSSDYDADTPSTGFSSCDSEMVANINKIIPRMWAHTAAGQFKNLPKQRSPVFGLSLLAHVKVRAFAFVHAFTDLAALALQRMGQTLLLSPSDIEFVFPHLAEAIRLVYRASTGPYKEDRAKELLCRYVACRMTSLRKTDLDDLAKEGGDFMVDLTKEIAMRMKFVEDVGAATSDTLKRKKDKVAKMTNEMKGMEDRINDLVLDNDHLRNMQAMKEEPKHSPWGGNSDGFGDFRGRGMGMGVDGWGSSRYNR